MISIEEYRKKFLPDTGRPKDTKGDFFFFGLEEKTMDMLIVFEEFEVIYRT